jgi:hypothetical protein
MTELVPVFPLPASAYPVGPGATLMQILAARLEVLPFNGVATAIFFLAVLHTFLATRFRHMAHAVQHAADERADAQGAARTPSFKAEVLHFFGEVEVVFGLWAVVLMIAITTWFDWHTAQSYLSDTVDYTEAMFVVVIMTMAATRPVVGFAEASMRRMAAIGGGTPAAWWLTILTVGPILGSLITEPAAMTISALLLSRQFYDLRPSNRLRYATLGLLFVHVSIGGTLTHFAAPPVLMVSRPWEWSTAFMATHFGWRAVLSVVVGNLLYFAIFRRELRALSLVPPVPDEDLQTPAPSVPGWIVTVHLVFLAFVVTQSHYPPVFIAAFLFFLGFLRATEPHQSALDLRPPLLVGFFLAGLVTHGRLQGWWIGPVLGSLTEAPLFVGAALLTAFNDNALITYLATLVPDMSDALKYAVVAGAVTGGGMTVIANAPNPAGQALLGRYFEDGVSPAKLAAGALVPTLVAAAAFIGF